MKRLIPACLATTVLLTSHAHSAENCSASEILKPDTIKYDSSILTFIAYTNTVDFLVKRNSSDKIGAAYQGYNLSYDDAQNMSSYYTSKTNNTLSQDASVSILSSKIPPEAYQTLAKCLDPDPKDVVITVKPGAAQQAVFQGTIKWNPIRPIVDPDKERDVSLIVTSGKTLYGDKLKIKERTSSQFQIERSNLDVPFYMTAYIDGQGQRTT